VGVLERQVGHMLIPLPIPPVPLVMFHSMVASECPLRSGMGPDSTYYHLMEQHLALLGPIQSTLLRFFLKNKNKNFNFNFSGGMCLGLNILCGR